MCCTLCVCVCVEPVVCVVRVASVVSVVCVDSFVNAVLLLVMIWLLAVHVPSVVCVGH